MASEQVKNLTAENFKTAAGNGVALIDFWAPWCAPCRAQGPIVDKVAEKADGATVAKVDVDQAPELAAQFGVSSIPTIVILKDGELKQRFVGVQSESALLSALEKAKSN